MSANRLSQVQEKIRQGDVNQAMGQLVRLLHEWRSQADNGAWTRAVQDVLLSHPLRQVVHEDPFTRRSFEKPRGYAGDAVLLDVIYRHRSVDLNGVSEQGRGIHAFCLERPSCQAVRFRRSYLAQAVDRAAAAFDRPKVLSVACGHLREAELCEAAAQGRLGAWYALDQDAASLEVVRRDYGALGVSPVCASVGDLIKGRLGFDDCALVYAAGLYDYLDDRVAKVLTARLFAMLVPGGTLLLANFLPEVADVGYMESFMGWHLIFRDEAAMASLPSSIPRRQVRRIELFTDPMQNVVFLEIRKEAN